MKKISISLLAAVSIDGRIAAYSGHKSDWTSKEDKDFLHSMLDASDCVVVGRNTYEIAREPLSKRNCIVFTNMSEKSDRGTVYFNPAKQDFSVFAKEKKYTSIAVLGGTGVYTYFLEHDLCTDLWLTIEPVVFGTGLALFETEKFVMKHFHLQSSRLLNSNGSILLHYTRL
ncbi:dihydrofolate reductase [Candidatus Uhrbacteria bacterium]|nr:dihydrofolate reductase [Candidatus Uhrbacteria bacterium]